jgi:MarR family transcriptional regulator, lower aerobic nicotinate degradation pathway regulator
MTDRKTSADMPGRPLTDVHSVPGHLIRRCQQIAVAIFLDEFRDAGVTPMQYAALATIFGHPGIDQRTLVDLVAIDRSTIGAILRGLEQRALIMRITPENNQRVKQLYVLPRGEELLRETRAVIDRVQERILQPLNAEDRQTFMRLLERVVDVNNELSRAPLRVGSGKEGEPAR